MRLFSNLFVFLILFLIAFPVFAEDEDSKPKKNSSVYIGGGFVSKQTYLGSSSRRFIWIPVAAFKYHNQDKNYLLIIMVFKLMRLIIYKNYEISLRI